MGTALDGEAVVAVIRSFPAVGIRKVPSALMFGPGEWERRRGRSAPSSGRLLLREERLELLHHLF